MEQMGGEELTKRTNALGVDGNETRETMAEMEGLSEERQKRDQ